MWNDGGPQPFAPKPTAPAAGNRGTAHAMGEEADLHPEKCARMTYAGKLRGRLSDIEPINPSTAQGPIPEHLMPGRKVAPVVAARPRRPRLAPDPWPPLTVVQQVIASFGEAVEAIPMEDPESDPPELPPAVAPEAPAERLARLRREHDAARAVRGGMDRKERERLAKRAAEALRRARRAAGDTERLRPWAVVGPVVERPACPNGCAVAPERRGKRRGLNRWHCPDCLRNWQA